MNAKSSPFSVDTTTQWKLDRLVALYIPNICVFCFLSSLCPLKFSYKTY